MHTQRLKSKKYFILVMCFCVIFLLKLQNPYNLCAGFGRSLRFVIGNLLDKWPLNEENMEKLEVHMTASERRTLMNNLVTEDTQKN